MLWRPWLDTGHSLVEVRLRLHHRNLPNSAAEITALSSLDNSEVEVFEREYNIDLRVTLA